jgi:hypothetical protein
MTLYALPAATRGDAHFLVVVTSRAAGGKGIPQPEGVLGRDAVGNIRERGRALVGGDYQVRIIAIASSYAGRCHDLAVDNVVGDVQQAADVAFVALFYFPGALVRGGVGAQPPRYEAALGTDRHNQGVLDVLGLHQPKDFGPEVFGALRPANAATGDGAAAHVYTLYAWAVHEDLECRSRFRQPGNQAWI